MLFGVKLRKKYINHGSTKFAEARKKNTVGWLVPGGGLAGY